eukprot:11148885-Lingulodinium_polyedra.AAC.1
MSLICARGEMFARWELWPGCMLDAPVFLRACRCKSCEVCVLYHNARRVLQCVRCVIDMIRAR